MGRRGERVVRVCGYLVSEVEMGGTVNEELLT